MESCLPIINFGTNQVWLQFVSHYRLDMHRQKQFICYLSLLLEGNELFNITAITDPEDIIINHFQDSVALLDHYRLDGVKTLADVGSGGGFPGIPLAIC